MRWDRNVLQFVTLRYGEQVTGVRSWYKKPRCKRCRNLISQDLHRWVVVADAHVGYNGTARVINTIAIVR